MDRVIPKPLQAVIEAFGSLPGVGPRTAERYAYYLLRNDPAKAQSLSDALSKLQASVKYCPKTFALIDKSAYLVGEKLLRQLAGLGLGECRHRPEFVGLVDPQNADDAVRTPVKDECEDRMA